LKPTKPAGRSGSWFADWVMPEAHELAGPYRGTVTFRTTIVPRLQAIAEKVLSDALDEEGVASGVSQAALVVMTPNGAVVAMVGGRDYGKSGFNRAVAAMRQPGSAFKLFVYYAALKAGFSPFDPVDDEPINIGGWSPENYDGHYRGRVSMAEAFARSLNAATVALAMEVGIDKVIAAARELGVDTELPNTPSLALGTAQMSPQAHRCVCLCSGRNGACRTVGDHIVAGGRPAASVPRRTGEAAEHRPAAVPEKLGRSAAARRCPRDWSPGRDGRVRRRQDWNEPKSPRRLVCRVYRAAGRRGVGG